MHHLRSLLPLLKPYRRGIVAGLVLVVLANIFAVIWPTLLGRTVDALGRPGVTMGQIWLYAGALVAITALAGLGRYGMRQLLNAISRRVETDLRDAFFARLLNLDAQFYNGMRTGDLMSRATSDIGAVRMAIGPAVMYLVNTLTSTVLTIAFMAAINVRLMLYALIPLMLIPPVVIVSGRLIHQRFERIQDHLGVLSTMVQENLNGVRIVRAYGQEKSQEREFDELNRTYLRKNMEMTQVSAIFHPLLTALTSLGMLTVLWLGGLDAIAGRISNGDFVAFGFYVAMLAWPVIALGWVTNLFQRGAASMSRINAIMQTEPAIRTPAEPVVLEAVRGEIEFRNVQFRYPGTSRLVLDHVSFRVAAGSTVAIVGPTGAGKSTIVSLLARRYDPTAGVILLDGVPLQELSLDQLRGAFGIVMQDAFLFSETISENIGMGLPPGALTERRIADAAAVAQLDATIRELPHGYETRLGERGVNLSGGQRQRATLARAIARDPRILILDDALSAVDTHTETQILQNLRHVLANRTALIISHRVSAVMDADNILVLDEGRIVEQGRHEQLIASGGLYASLLRRQLLAEDLGIDNEVSEASS